MLMTSKSLRRLSSRLLAEDRGIAAVEFALILPIMLTLWIGGVEVTSALNADRRLNNLAASVGDLVSREKEVTEADIAAVFDIAPSAMYPDGEAGLSVRITAVKVDDTGVATVAWSRAEPSDLAYAGDAAMNSVVPEALRVPNTRIIMSEAFFTYVPTIGSIVSPDGIELEDRLFFVPRLSSEISLCPQADSPADQCVS